MSLLPSIAASGLALLERGERGLATSARVFGRLADDGTRGDAGAADASAAPDASSAVDAALGVVYGRTEFATGVALLRVGRDTEQALIDVLA